MATNKVQEGETAQYTASAAIDSGQLLDLTTLVAIASEDAAIGDTIAIFTEKVWDVPKATNLSFAQFAKAYHDGTEGVNATTTGTKAGLVWKAAAATDTTVAVKINAPI